MSEPPCPSTLKVPASDFGRSADIPGTAEQSSDLADPVQIGPYRILERLGEGGMGMVYLAEEREPVRRLVALKLIRAGMDTPEILARFEAERQALAILEHPNIARVLHAGVTQGGCPYFAMEHVRGLPLTQYCDENRLTVAQRLELFLTVCQAVQYAHQKGIIHRDLKPSNILVTVVDDRPVPKVIDFGTAKSVHQLSGRTLHTRMGSVLGTPQYMAPEQAGTADLDVDTRADIYALGVILYELLSGTLPLDAQTLRDATPQRLVQIIRDTDAPKPSARVTAPPGGLTGRWRRRDPKATTAALETAARRRTDCRALAREIRGDLDCITGKAMEKDRTRRYASVDAIAQDVRRHLNHEPILARPPSRVDRVRKFARRHSAALGAAAAVLAALLIGLSVATVGFVRARHERDAARASAAHAEAVSAFLRETLASMPETARGPTVSVRSLLDAAAERLDRGAFRYVPQAEAAVRATLGRTYAALHLNSAAEPHLTEALRIQERLHPNQDHPDVAHALRDLADVLPARSESDAVESLARRGLEMTRRLWSADSRDVADAQSTLAAVLLAKGDYAGAEPLYEDALRILKALLKDDPDVATAMSNLADVRRLGNGGPAAAEPLHRQALEMFRRHLGEHHPSVGTAYRNLANVLMAKGDLANAESAQRQAIDAYRQSLGDDNQSVLDTTIGLAQIIVARHDHGRAAQVLLERHRWLTKQPEPSPAEDVKLSQQIASVYRAWGNPVEARQWIARARSLQYQSLLKELDQESQELRRRPDDAALLTSRAKHFARAGKFENAATDYDRAMRLGVSDHWAWYVRAALLAYLERDYAYEAHCRDMLVRFREATGRPAVRIAKACLLRPLTGGGVDLTALHKTAVDARVRDLHPKDISWDEMVVGMAEHRRNRPEQAVEHLSLCLEKMQSNPAAAATGYYLAINLHRLGRTEQAAAAFERAARAMADLPMPGDGDLGESGIENWLIARLAQREATQVLRPGQDK
jgi:serine/threonine protein kinase/tetratricopeptide (TPR) repeat protein